MRMHSFRHYISWLVLVAASTAAEAADWRYAEPQPTGQYEPATFFAGPRGSVLASYGDHLRRFGSRDPSLPDIVPERSTRVRIHDVIPLDDGGAIVSAHVDNRCAIGRYDATLKSRWFRLRDRCMNAGANANGTVWYAEDNALLQLAGDGSLARSIDFASLDLGGTPPIDAVAVHANGDVTFAARTGATTGFLTHLSRRGEPRWRLPLKFSASENGRVTQLDALPNGHVALAAVSTVLADQNNSISGSFAAIVDSGGSILDGLQTYSPMASRDSRIAVYDGGFYAIGSGLSNGTEIYYASSRWPLPISAPCLPRGAKVAVARNGDIVIPCRATNGTTVLERYTLDGERFVSSELPLSVVTTIAFSHDNTLFVAGYELATPYQRSRLFAFGERMQPLPMSDFSRAEDVTAIASAFNTDGTSHLVARVGAQSTASDERLTKLDAQGGVIWTRSVAADVGETYDVRSGGGRVCLTGTRPHLGPPQPSASSWHVACFDDTNGALVWKHTAPAYAAATTAVLPDGNYFNVHSANGQLLIARFGPDGRPLQTTTIDGSTFALRLRPDGVVTVATRTQANERLSIRRYDSNGIATTTQLDIPDLHTFSNGKIADAPDGGILLLGERGRREGVRLWSIGANGALRWVRDIAQPADRSIDDWVLLVSDRAYVAQHDRDWTVHTRIDAVDLTDGDLAWQTTIVADKPVWPFDPVNDRQPHIAPTPDGRALVLAHTLRTGLRLTTVDTATGALAGERNYPCGDLCAQSLGISVDNDLTLRVALTTFDRDTGRTAMLSAASARPLPSTRLDQPGIAGSWWSPYANGEGFVLDWLPDSRTLFMPWFTFSRDGGNDPAGQRWYVVQGAVPADATQVELPITESTGGAFDAGPSVTPTIVGTATLSFTDCDNGTLRYRFDEGHNGAATGTITLSRLSPATQNCILADGSTQTRTVAPTNGFDARMSGSWFEPATSGQGIQLTVQPGGIFFAPWFTFDPAGASDDPGKQRWFTIQGSLADARNGVATLPIVQTIGGAFDSVPTNNMYAVGSATITMLACDRAKVDYRYDDNELAAAMRNRSGSIDLVKAGGCMR